MENLISPLTPELSCDDIKLLAAYAKALGHAKNTLQTASLSGNRLSNKKGHGLDLHEVRPYTTTDEVRHIDWRITARTGTPHTRVYTEDIEHRNFIVMNLSQDAYFGTQTTFISTRYAQLAALIGWRSHHQREPFGLMLNYADQQFAMPQVKDWQAMAETLADSTQVKHRVIPTESFQLATLPPIRSHNLIILSDQLWVKDSDQMQLAQLAQHNRTYWISLEDPNIFALPEGQYRFLNQSSKQPSRVTQKTLEAAQQQFQTQQTRFEELLLGLGITRLQFSVDESPIAVARTLLSRGVIH